MKTLQHLAAITFLLIVAPVVSNAQVPFQSEDHQGAEPLQKSIGEGREATGSDNISTIRKAPTAQQVLEINGITSDATPAAPETGVPHLRTNPDCLAAAYDFSDLDPASGRVRDTSGNGFDLTTVGEPAAVAGGIVGKGALLNGGYFQAKGNPLAGTDHFTISVWFKTAEPMNNYKLVSAAVWHGGNNASGWNVGTHYSEFWADNQEGSLRGEPGWERNTEFRKSAWNHLESAWNHLVLTYDGACVREYINGELSANIRGTGRRVGDGVPMTVGAWMGGFQFHGVLDEVRIYRRALKEPEIQSLHRAPTGG